MLALATLLGACSSDVNPMKAAAIAVGSGPRDVKAPDFVEKSRKADGDFMAVGESAPAPAIRARTPKGQQALESELTGARNRNEALGRAAEGAGKDAAKGLAPAPVQ